MTFEGIFRDLFEKTLRAANQDFLAQHKAFIFRPIEFSGEQITDGKNRFAVSLVFEPCEGADAMPSAN
jgi:hypothetical protein